MNEIQLVEKFAKARGLSLRGEISRESAREVLLPLLILDIGYSYLRKIRPEDFRYQAKHHAKRMHAAYNRINGWFFSGLKDELEDEAIALMDELEESVNFHVMVTETAIWNVFKMWPEPTCGHLVSAYMLYLMAAGAGAAWEQIFHDREGAQTRNRAILEIQVEAKRFAVLLMGSGRESVPESRVKPLRDAEAILGRKLVQWTRQTGRDEN